MSSVTAEAQHAPPAHSSATGHASLTRRAYAALLRRLERWFDLHLVWIFRRTLVPPVSAPPPEGGYSFRELTARELLAAAADPVLELSRERIQDAVLRGHLFFGVLHLNRIVAYRWYSLAGSSPCWEGMEIRYDHPYRAYGYRTFTHPAHRGKHMHAYTTGESDRVLVARGCTHTIGYIDATNFASLRAYSRLRGARRVGGILSLRAFGRHWIFRSPGAIYHAVTIARA
jgi:hypothetical protein